MAARGVRAPSRRSSLDRWLDGMSPSARTRVAVERLGTSLADLLERRVAYVLVLPTVAAIVIVNLVPISITAALSLTKFKLSTPEPTFVGAENFLRLARDPVVIDAFRISAIVTFSTVALSFTIGLLAALLLDRRFKGRGLARSLFIIPWTVRRSSLL